MNRGITSDSTWVAGVLALAIAASVPTRAAGAFAPSAATGAGTVLAATVSKSADRGPGWGMVAGGTLAGGIAGLALGFALGRLSGAGTRGSNGRAAAIDRPATRRAWDSVTPTAPSPPPEPPAAATGNGPPEPPPPDAGRKRAWEK